jgi:processive 1,2-diacylglycerol beta-glucosyltransferase
MHTVAAAEAPRTPEGSRGVRVLILCADVGAGHVTVVEALAERLQRRADVRDVTVSTTLTVLGERFGRFLMRGFERHLEVKWTYDLAFRLVMGFAPARWFGITALYRLGGRPLLRFIERERPDVIVAEYPLINAILGELRRRRRLDVPVCASISDPSSLHFWARPGIDVHLLSWAESRQEVDRIAGPGYAEAVVPLVARRFISPPSQDAARRALRLPVRGRVVVVSGGGWGVGDLDGAVEVALARSDATVVCLAGRNDRLRERLELRHAGDARVRVLGFTTRMPDLLAAADALVHSTGGTTCLEARVCGCPTINYGFAVGHVRAHAEAMRDLGIAELARSADELGPILERVLAGGRRPPLALDGLRPADDVVVERARQATRPA